MIEDRTFQQIIERVSKLFPDSDIHIGKEYSMDEDENLFITYYFYVGGLTVCECGDFGTLCHKVNDFISEYDENFRIRCHIKNRMWKELFGGNNGNS